MTETGHETVTGGTGYAGRIGDTGYTGRRRRSAAGSHRWHLSVEDDGQLMAMLAESEPPLRVSGESLASLRRQIRNVTLRGLL